MANRYAKLLAAVLAAVLLFSACAHGQSGEKDKNDKLTWSTWGNYNRFLPVLELVEQNCPDIEIEFLSYAGANATGYSWAQMRAGDISDIFITSQILDGELARERLADLSGYDFVNNFPTAILDQISIDGGVYLLPVNNTMYGIYYNKTLMEEHGWALPQNFSELEALCAEISDAGLIPGVVGTRLTGGPFSTMLNLAKTDWFTTPEGVNWEQDFLAGNALAEGRWEDTMDLAQRYIDAGMFTTDPDDRINVELISDYLGGRKAVFCTAVQPVGMTEFPETGDKLGMMPYISEDGGKNVYMYSPFFYIGISGRLTEPGNEKKLEDAVRILSLLFSPEGQARFVNENTPCVMSVAGSARVPEDSLIYDAQQAMWEGRAFPMTYAGWDHVLADMGQAFKEWFRGENQMDGARCITRMDELQRDYLDNADRLYFCESTADFTLEETAKLVGKAAGTATGADAVLVGLGAFHDGKELRAGVTGKLYAGKINADTVSGILPGVDGEYAVMEMTGAQAKALAEAGFDADGDGNPYQYLLVAKGDRTLEDGKTYRVAFLTGGYTQETAEAYGAETVKGSLWEFMRTYLEQEGTVSPDGNPWE